MTASVSTVFDFQALPISYSLVSGLDVPTIPQGRSREASHLLKVSQNSVSGYHHT